MTATLALCAILAGQAEIPRGSGSFPVARGAERIEVFTYKPESYRDGPMILVFHGVLRNAEEYRDHARGMGDRFGALIVAPKFPEDQFPIPSYQEGGLILGGEPQPRDRWTWQFVPRIVEEVGAREGREDMPYYLIGHSGGGQFLIRFSGFMPTEAERIVVSNPGTYLFPSREHTYPFGFGGLGEDLSGDEALRRYLAQPITLYLAMDDTQRDEHFDVTPRAERQGRTRRERGENAFRAAEELARSKGWEFRWRIVRVEGVGHDHEAMFDHALCREALFGPDPD